MRHSSGWPRKILPTANCRARRRSASFRPRGAGKRPCPKPLCPFGLWRRIATRIIDDHGAGANASSLSKREEGETEAKQEMQTAAVPGPGYALIGTFADM